MRGCRLACLPLRRLIWAGQTRARFPVLPAMVAASAATAPTAPACGRTDVVVVGGGVAGCLASWQLLQHGLKVHLVDMGRFRAGALGMGCQKRRGVVVSARCVVQTSSLRSAAVC